MTQKWSPEKKALFQITMWTVSIIVVLTLFNFLFVLHTVGPGLHASFSRNIASVPKAELTAEDFKTPVVHVNCDDRKNYKQIVTKAPTARIKIIGCGDIESITNRTNKNQADLFPLSKKEWTSDFIFLSPGVNQLAVQRAGEDYLIEITREKDQAKDQNTAL